MSAMSPHVQQTSVAFTSDRNMCFRLVNNLDEGSVDGEPSCRYLWCIHKAVAVWRIIDQWCHGHGVVRSEREGLTRILSMSGVHTPIRYIHTLEVRKGGIDSHIVNVWCPYSHKVQPHVRGQKGKD